MARTKRAATKNGSRAHVIVVKPGANRETDWTPLPPDEQSVYPKYVRAGGGDCLVKGRDAVSVTLHQNDPEGRGVLLSIGIAPPENPNQTVFMDLGLVGLEQPEQLLQVLSAAIESAREIGLLPPASARKIETRNEGFTYTGERGMAGVSVYQKAGASQ